MPPFITYNGQTGYFQNGQFIPATREQYDGLFNGNPFMNNPMFSNLAGRQQPLQQGQIVEPAMSNEQKIAQQSSNVPLEGTSSIQYGMTDQGLGFNQGKTFYPSTAMTKTGMALIGNPALGITANPYELQGAHNPYAPQAALVQQQALQQAIDNNQQQTVQGPQVQQTGVPLNLSKDGIFGAIQNPFVSQTETPEAIVTESKADGMIGPMSGGKAPVVSNVTETATPVKSKMTNAQSQGLGMLIGAGAKLVKAVAPDNYDERVGMTKPNMIGTLAGDATFTQLGSAFGPVGLAVGGGVDIVKNILAYAKQKDKYDNKKIGVNTMQSMDDARESMKPDYTGYARYGAEVKNPFIKHFAFGGPVDPIDPKKKELTGLELYNSIYNSKGHDKRLKHSQEQSSKMLKENPNLMYGRYIGDTDMKYNSESINSNFEDLKKMRLKGPNAPVYDLTDDILKEYKKNPSTEAMMIPTGTWNEEKQAFDLSGSIYMKNEYKGTNQGKYINFEESRHFGNLANTAKEDESNYNFLPYEIKLINENIPIKNPLGKYGTNYTEISAKKGAIDAYLIDKGLLNPGEDVNDTHYEYLYENQESLPGPVRQGFMMYLDDNDYDKYLKENGPEKYNNFIDQEKSKAKQRFKNIQNSSVMNDSENPYLQYGRSGIYIKPENRGKFTNWAQSHDMSVSEAANTVMENKEKYSPSVVKMANFAKNATKWG